jgi:hypothetical protein
MEGLAAGDLSAIGEAASSSARCHQAILQNPLLDSAFIFSKELGAEDVCRGHSGSVVGLIFPEDYDIQASLEYLTRRLPSNGRTYVARLTGWGQSWGRITRVFEFRLLFFALSMTVLLNIVPG